MQLVDFFAEEYDAQDWLDKWDEILNLTADFADLNLNCFEDCSDPESEKSKSDPQGTDEVEKSKKSDSKPSKKHQKKVMDCESEKFSHEAIDGPSFRKTLVKIDNNYSCSHCPKMFKKLGNFWSHLTTEHKYKFLNEFGCTICKVPAFKSLKAVLAHEKKVHKL